MVNDGNTINQWFTAIWATLPTFMYGIIAGWMSPAAALLQSENSPSGYPLSDSVISWMASSMALVASIIVYFYSWLIDRYGRRLPLLLLSLPALLSIALKLYPQNETALVISSVAFGLLSGGAFLVPPIYIREISETKMRGTLGSLVMLLQNIGILVAYIMGALLDYYTILNISICIPFIHIVLTFKAPESPNYLVKVGKIKEAIKSLAWLRSLDMDDKRISEVVEAMRTDNDSDKTNDNISIKEILSNKSNRLGLYICLVLIFVQAAGGCFAVITYAGTILSNTDIDANLQAIAIAVVLIGGAAFAVVTVEKFGRKILFVVSSLLVSLSMCTFGVVMTLKYLQLSSPPSWIPIVALITAIFSYGFGTSPLPLIIMSEMFSLQIRSKLSSIVVSYSWITSFLSLLLFKPLVNFFGLHVLFFIFAGINIFGGLFAIIWLPETKGKTVQEIEKLLVNK